MKVIGYVRVSTEEQAEHGYGLDAQRNSITAYTQAMGYEIERVIVDDGYSGSKMERPGMNELLELVESGEYDGVLVFKLDRISRNLKDILNLHDDTLVPNGCSIISVKEQFDTSTAAGKLFFQMIGGFAEFERSVITERMVGGRKQKASQGGYAGGGVPLGYVTERGTGKIAIDESKVETVRQIFALRAQGLSMPKICDALNAVGHTTREGKKFSAMTVKRVLDNEEFYRGNYVYDKKSAGGAKVVEGAAHEAIL